MARSCEPESPRLGKVVPRGESRPRAGVVRRRWRWARGGACSGLHVYGHGRGGGSLPEISGLDPDPASFKNNKLLTQS
eukprot:4293182-Pyramimonas_sp.AAC.1